MKALSIRQPYVEQILTGKKKIEYRTVKTNFRGKFYIYSSQKVAYECDDELPKGLIVGTAELVDCRVKYYLDDPVIGIEGYDWIIKNPKRLKRPLKPKNKPQPVWFNPF